MLWLYKSRWLNFRQTTTGMLKGRAVFLVQSVSALTSNAQISSLPSIDLAFQCRTSRRHRNLGRRSSLSMCTECQLQGSHISYIREDILSLSIAPESASATWSFTFGRHSHRARSAGLYLSPRKVLPSSLSVLPC